MHPHSHHHDQEDEHTHSHAHAHSQGRLAWLREAIPFLHKHDTGSHMEEAMETSARGLWALKVSLAVLGVTALFQLVIVLVSGSAGLLADTIHNLADAFTAIPLGIAFILARRPATRRYTYGYGRAEDLAGAAIVLIIFLSALLAGYESVQKLLHPEPLQYAVWVMIAAIVGFLGNEGVAIFRIRVGRQIGSAALAAEGQHARADGLTLLAVLFGAIGSLAGIPLVDPTIGLLITVAILFVVKDTALAMWRRLMDGVEPALVDDVERIASAVPGVQSVHGLHMRWIGHGLHAELHITVDEDLSTWESHELAERACHALFETYPRMEGVLAHVDPCGHGNHDGKSPRALTAGH